MAWSKGRRKAPFKRKPTHWRELPGASTAGVDGRGLARSTNEGPVVSCELLNVFAPDSATPSGTLSAVPYELTLDDDLTSAATEDHKRATMLRCVGMLRPIAVKFENEAETFSVSQGFEVRYGIVRLNEAELKGEAFLNAASAPSLNHVDLFDGKGLGSEGIAFIRSFLVPTRPVTDPVETAGQHVVGMYISVMQTLPWWHNNEMTVLDLKSKRRIGTTSKMYLLRQVRRYDGSHLAPDRILSAELYHADVARVLLGGRE